MMDSKTESNFIYKGYPCVVLFQSRGYRCGYVGVPNDSIFARKSIIALDSVLSVHGGITYSNDYLYGQEGQIGTWWIGFDCGHAWDGYDVEATKKYFDKDITDIAEIYKDNEARTREYVENECCDLVNQIRCLENIGYTDLDLCIAYMKNGSDDMRDEIVKCLEDYKTIREKDCSKSEEKMKGNGLERDTLEGVIADLEKIDATWRNGSLMLNYATLRDALHYLKEYQDALKQPPIKRCVEMWREMRGEK